MTDDQTPSGALAEVLHDLSVGLFKARLLLEEADPAEWRSVAGRLSTLRGLLAGFPTSPRPRRALGFVSRVAGRKHRK